MSNLRDKCLEWIKDELNNDFEGAAEENLPGGVLIALDIMEENILSGGDDGRQSETHRHISISYFQSKISNKIMDLIAPYRKMAW